MWEVKEHLENSVTFTYTSPDGEDGFPSELVAEVTYSLEGDALVIDYKATPNGTTPISMTNHAYFNLDGFGKDIMNHTIKVFADSITEVDDYLIPTGNRPSVQNTRFDLRGGIKQVKYGAICLEAQTEPNSVNLGIDIYKNGETYTQTTVYKIERKDSK